MTDLVPERKKASWMALRALASSFESTTAEMLSSLEPWAIAEMLTPLRPREWNTRPEMPGVFFMRSPTTAMMALSSSMMGGPMRPSASSAANSSPMAATTASLSPGETAKQIDLSLEAWEMRMMFTRLRARQPKSRIAMPVTPTMPGPCTRTRAVAEMEEMPRTG